METITKICSKCKEGKSTSNFVRASNAKDGLFSWCKQCTKRHSLKIKNTVKIIPKFKICSKCNIKKENIFFNGASRSYDGLTSSCKSCRHKEYLKTRTTEILVSKKTCSKCKKEFNASNFFKDTRSKTGLRNECKDCHYSKTNISKLKKSEYDKRRRSTKEHKKKRLANERKRLSTDVHFKLQKSLRDRIRKAIKNKQKKGSAIRDLGCSVGELKFFLEKQFQPGMTWKNHGLHGWHLDHIKPLSLFNLTDRKQFLEACHYTNLQPLWAFDNLSKGNKYEEN